MQSVALVLISCVFGLKATDTFPKDLSFGEVLLMHKRHFLVFRKQDRAKLFIGY